MVYSIFFVQEKARHRSAFFNKMGPALINEAANSRMKTMKPNFKTFPHSQVLARTFLAAVAVLALSTAYTFAGVVNATYTTGAEVPVSSNGFTATGKTVNFTLNYAPSPGTQLMVVQNTAPGIIRGTFSNLAQGQIVALSYGGLTYHFVANYYGGAGNDLVLLWTSAEKSLPAATLKKLDSQILLALKKSRGEPPFDKPTSLEPNIPIKDGSSVLVDLDVTGSSDLLTQIALIGGKVVQSPDPAHIIRAMVPLSQLETLAGRADVKSISPARPSITSGVKASP
jgi:hypothetical protein